MKAAHARLMLGDRKGADEAFNRFLEVRGQLHDSLVPLRKAQWETITGRRKEAFARLSAWMEAERGRNPDAAAFAAAQLALWRIQMGERTKARETAAAASSLARTPQSKTVVALAAFLAQEPATAVDWRQRAARAFPDPRMEPFKQLALLYAFLYDGHFREAEEPLRARVEQSPNSPLQEISTLYGWALAENGRMADAERLLARYPVPDLRSDAWFSSLAFPRALLLRANLFEARGDANRAEVFRKLFRQYAGDSPRMFGGR